MQPFYEVMIRMPTCSSSSFYDFALDAWQTETNIHCCLGTSVQNDIVHLKILFTASHGNFFFAEKIVAFLN